MMHPEKTTTYGHTIVMQTLSDYVWNLGNANDWGRWHNCALRLHGKHPLWRPDQSEAMAFTKVFPGLTLPPQFEPKP